MKLPFRQALKLIETAVEKENREHYYRQWLARFTLMDKESYVSFEDFYESTKTPSVDTRPTDEIMKELLGEVD